MHVTTFLHEKQTPLPLKNHHQKTKKRTNNFLNFIQYQRAMIIKKKYCTIHLCD